MTINTFTTTPPFTPFYPAEQNNSAYLSAATDPIKIIPDEVIKMVADSGGWHLLGVRLGITQNQLNTIIINSGYYQHLAAYHMLYKWLDKEGVAATPAALCSALEDIKLAGISRHIESVLLVNTQYFCSMPQSSADTRDAPAPMVNPGYYGDNSQLSFESRPAFIDINPPRLQECAAMATDAAGYESEQLEQMGSKLKKKTQPLKKTESELKEKHQLWHDQERFMRINDQAIEAKKNLKIVKSENNKLKEQASAYEFQLKQMKSELDYKDKQLSEVRREANISNDALLNQQERINKLTIINEELKAEIKTTQSHQHLDCPVKQNTITDPQPGAERVNSENAVRKAEENTLNQPFIGNLDLRFEEDIEQMREQSEQNSIEKSVLKASMKALQKDYDSQLRVSAELRNNLIKVQQHNMLLKKIIKDLSSSSPNSAYFNSLTLPPAAIVPDKNTRGACGYASVRPAKKPKPGT